MGVSNQRSFVWRSGAVAAVVALAASLGSPIEAGAQPPPWRTNFDVSFSSTSGNQNMSIWNSDVRVRHNRPDVANFDLRVRGRYGVSEVDGVRQRAQEFYRADFRIDIVPGTLGPYVETRIQHDPFRDWKLIVNTGAGARYRMGREDDRGRADLRIALLHSFDSRPARDPIQRARWNMEMEGRQSLTDGISITHSTKFQPLHDQLDEYMLSLDTRLNIRLTDRLSLLIRHEFERDTDPPLRRPIPDDTVITAGVSVEL